MPVVKTFEGVGALIVGDERHTGAKYRIDISRVGNSLLSAQGSLSVPEMPLARGAVMQAFTAGSADLELQAGGVVHIVPSQMGFADSPPTFRFVASGPIPGFSAE